MDQPVRYVPAAKQSHDLVWDRESGECQTLEGFMVGRDYGEVARAALQASSKRRGSERASS